MRSYSRFPPPTPAVLRAVLLTSEAGRRNMHDNTDHQQAILDSLAEGVLTVDEHWNITAFNRAAESLTGVARSEAIGRKCFDVMRSTICQQHCALRESLSKANARVDRHAHIRNRAGQAIPVEITAMGLPNGDGSSAGGVATFRDLSVLERLRREIEQRYSVHDIVSKHHQLRQVLDGLPCVASGDGPVLIQGPVGTGKQLLARAIHQLSPRRDHGFVAVHCGALPESLLESELFGHVRGALPGAKHDRHGRLHGAMGGTLLLDEIGAVTRRLQRKLLQVIDEKRYQPLGDSAARPADVRIIVASPQPLRTEVDAGRFDQELYARLQAVTIALPALSERREDIPLLVQHFIRQFNDQLGTRVRGISQEALQRLMRHPLPGNVRQLRSVVEYAIVTCGTDRIELDCLPAELLDAAPADPEAKSLDPLARAEADAIRQTLLNCGGHRGRTAEALGIDKSTLWRKMKRYGL